jgi:hypothetical protein
MVMFNNFIRQNTKKNQTRGKIADIGRLVISQILKFFCNNPDSSRKNASNQNVTKDNKEARGIGCRLEIFYPG